MARRKSLFSRSALTGGAFTRAYTRGLKAMTQATLRSSRRVAAKVAKAAVAELKPPRGPGDWLSGLAVGAGGARRFHLYRPPGLLPGERLPLLVMLHGCGQTGGEFASSTRMNLLAARERFFVLYPEQERLANSHGCWNWFERRSGKADAEAASIVAALDQACLLYPVDRERVAIAGLSAGASMAALVATRYAMRFRAVAMHSGVAPGAAKSSATAIGAMRGRHAPPMLTTAVGKAMGAAAAFTTLPPMLLIHGDADHIVVPANATRSAEVWATATGASAAATRQVQRGQRHPMRVTEYRRAGRCLVSLCEVSGLGHAWSGGAARLPWGDPKGPDASRIVWSFACRQFAPRPVG